MDLDILLLGKTGVGKSATGNSLIGHKAFSSVASTQSVTVDSQKEVTQLQDGRVLRVVDTPGVGDTRGSEEKGQKMFLKAIREAIVMNPHGYHALLMVLKFGNRLTKEDEDTIKHLKNVFGQEFIRKYCILVMTNGDDFKHQQDDGDIEVTFMDWCRQQGGYFHTVFQEANERIILFDNRCNKNEKESQRRELVDMIDKLLVGGRRYTNEKFEKALREYEKVQNDENMAIISDKIRDETSLILSEFDRIKAEGDVDRSIVELRRLMGRIQAQHNLIEAEKNPNGLMVKVLHIVMKAQSQVEQHLLFRETQKQLEEKQRHESDLAQREIARLQQLVADQSAQQKVNDKNVKDLRNEFIEVRDANNRSIGEKIWDVVTWPFSTVASWFS